MRNLGVKIAVAHVVPGMVCASGLDKDGNGHPWVKSIQPTPFGTIEIHWNDGIISTFRKDDFLHGMKP